MAFFSWFRFYVIHGSVQRDYETRVGQIIATTLLNRVLYAFGKMLSNFAILCTMTAILALAGVLMGISRRGAVEVWPLWSQPTRCDRIVGMFAQVVGQVGQRAQLLV